MPLSDQEFQQIDSLMDPPKPDLHGSLDVALQRNPDQHAENLLLANSLQLPVDTVERNKDEVKRADTLKKVDPPRLQQTHPKTAQFLSNPDHASLAVDDLDVLKGLEDHLSRTWSEAGIDTAVDLTRGVISFGESVVGLADLATGNAAGNLLAKIGYDPAKTHQILSEFYSKSRVASDVAVQQAEGFWGTLGALAEHPSSAFGTAVQSAPMMIGIMGAARAVAVRMLAKEGIAAGTPAAAEFLSRPDVIAKITTASAASEGAQSAGQIQEMARQSGRDWASSVIPAVSAGITTALIGKLSSKVLPDVETMIAIGQKSRAAAMGGMAATRIAESVVKEGVLEEAPQSALEQVWQNLAMGKPWDQGVGQAAAQGLVAGSMMGGGATGIAETASMISRIESKAKRDEKRTLKSVFDQNRLDSIIELSQQSKLNQRAKDVYADFLNGTAKDMEVFIPADVAEQIQNPPSYIADQLDGSGSDITVPMSTFLTEMVPNEEIMKIVRPHTRLAADTMSSSELESDEGNAVKRLVEKAQKAVETRTQADEIYDQVKDQIVATGRQSEQTARLSAQLIPAYVTVKAQQHGISPREVYEAMGLKIQGPAAPVPAGGQTIVNQPTLVPQQNFSGIQIKDEMTVAETGQTVEVTHDAQRVWDQTQKRRDMIDKLRGCLGA